MLANNLTLDDEDAVQAELRALEADAVSLNQYDISLHHLTPSLIRFWMYHRRKTSNSLLSQRRSPSQRSQFQQVRSCDSSMVIFLTPIS